MLVKHQKDPKQLLLLCLPGLYNLYFRLSVYIHTYAVTNQKRFIRRRSGTHRHTHHHAPPSLKPQSHQPTNQMINQRSKSKTLKSSPITMPTTPKSLFKKTLLLSLLLLLLSLYALSQFLKSHNPNSQFPQNDTPKVKIYMYDLPRKFTYGVIDSYTLARGGRQTAAGPTYPGNQHPAEWHLFSSLTHQTLLPNSPIVRTLDPDQADLFYVPFFSSLSLVVGPNGGGYSDEEMQEELVRWLEGSVWWRRNNGRDHVFVCQDPNALYKVVDRVKNGVLLVSDFGRLGRETASFVKDVVLPYSHRIRTFDGEVGVEGREALLFFMGNRYRKEGGKIRDLLFQLLENERDVIIKHGAQSRESRRAASQGMHTSKFCLHPAGDTPSACRLFDAIVSLCVPVVVSNQIELPFEDAIDYSKIAIFVDSALAVKPGYLIKLLRGVSTERLLEYQKELKKVKHYFEYDNPNETVNEIWRQVAQKLPLIKLMINRDKRLVPRESPEPDCACLCSNQSGTLSAL